MTKKSTILHLMLTTFLAVFFSASAYAGNYSAECQTPKGKYKKCSLEFLDGALSVRHAAKKDKEFDLMIEKGRIKQVIEGTSKKGGSGPVRPGEIDFYGLLFARTMHDFLIQYLAPNGEPKDVLVRVKKKYGTAVATSLKDMQGNQE